MIARWLALLLLKAVFKVSPMAALALWWHYRPDEVIGFAVGVAGCVVIAAALLAVVLRAHAVYRAACIRRGQQLGIWRDPDPLTASARLLRMRPLGRNDR